MNSLGEDRDQPVPLQHPVGVLVAGIAPASPAEEAGLEKGDILLTVSGQPLNGMYAEDLPGVEWTLAEMPVDKPLPVTLLRNGAKIECDS